MLKTAPDPVDVQDLQFKLRCRLKIFEEATNFPQPCNLIACASRFGLIFVGGNTAQFQVIQLNHFEDYSKSDGDISDYLRRTVPTPSPLKYLSVNCEHTVLSVVIEKNNCPVALFYDVKSFWQKDILQLTEVRLSPTPGVNIVDVNWNPALGAIFTACKSDGTLGIYELKNPGVDINELPAAAGATCFCWSPKGKQIAIGSRDGKITQYKPDLKAVKVINAPPLKEPHLLISLQWISNYQFIGVFSSVSSPNQPCLIVIDAPKTGETVYINYDDICYSNGNTRPVQFYMITEQHWNLLLVASSNSMEVGILGHSNETWTQWIMGDAARAELPLSVDHQETLPVGFGLDIGCMQQLPWGESVLPPCPILLVLSHYGTLCCFNVVNLKEGAPVICTPPDPIEKATGLDCFVRKIENRQNVTKEQTTPKPTKSLPPPASTVFEITTTNSPSSKPSELMFPTTQPLSMFGGQATLIPVVSQANKNILSVPQPTATYSAVADDSKAATPTQKSFFPKEIASSTPQPQLSLSNTNVSKAPHPKLKEESSVDLKPEEEVESLFAQMVKEECLFLESEVKVTLHQSKTLKINLGTEEDKTKIVETTKSIQDFFKELVDICTTQNSEIHILKQNLLQSWAWYEEVKSRYAASKDESRMIILRAQPLDSASEKQLEDIRHVNYYLESQIAQAHRALDEQWENFQDYCRKTNKMQIPTMEVIFQTMVKQNAILRKQNYILKDIGSRIKSKSRSGLGSSLLLSVESSKELSDELKRLRMSPEDICQMQYEHVVNRMKNLTKKKSDCLRSFLKKREFPHVSAVRPQLSTSIIQTSPSSKLKSMSLAESKTPVKDHVVKKLEFGQSTPKISFVTPEEPLIESQNPIEGLQSFTHKFEAKNFNKEQSFTPLNKNMIASSPNSAFVATSFGTAVSTSISTSSSFKPVIFGTSTTASVTVTKPQSSFITTAASITKPQSNFLITESSLQSATNLSKPFSFASGSTVFQKDTNKFSTPAGISTNPAFSFTMQPSTLPKSTTVLTFAKNVTPKSSTSLFDTTSKPSLTSTPVSSTQIKSTMVFGSTVTTTTSPFSIQNIFGEKSEAIPTATKPFMFSSGAPSKSTATPIATTTAQSRTTFSTTSTPQSVLFVSPQSSGTSKSTQSTTPSVAITPKTQAVVSSTVSSPTSVLGGNQFSVKPTSGIFTTNAPSSLFSTPLSSTASQASIFGTTTTAKPSIFAASTTVVSTPTTTATLTVSAVSTAAVTTTSTSSTSVTAPLNMAFGATTTSQTSIFGSSVTSTNTSQSSFTPVSTMFSGFSFGGTATTKPIVFGSTDTSTTKSSIFGSTDTSTTKQSIFGSTPASTTVAAFGTSSTAATQNVTPVFGTTKASQPSVFGTAVTTATSPVFGSVAPSTNSQFGMFGDSSQKSSIFGSTASSATATQSSIFGSTQNTVFGATPTTTTATTSTFTFKDPKSTQSVFGSQSSGFGSSVGSSFGTASGGNIFGSATPTAFGQSSGSIFGSAATTTSGSIFGTATPTTSSVFGSSGTSVFGTPTSTTTSVFGSSNAFSSTTQSTPFVANTSSTSFGFGGLNVGSTPATSGSVFGGSQTANPFGGGTKSVFGNASTNTATSSIFGSSGGSVFGPPAQQTTFGSTTFGTGSGGSQSFFGQQQQSSTFGQSAFGSSTFGQQNTGGPFSAGGSGSVAQSGFGGSPTFQKPGGFGSSTVFGSSPSFGSAPSFGGAPAFGSSPAFGSPSKIFGAGSSSFGASPTAQNTSFGNLANQPTVGFGNLAQQAASAPAAAAPFSGNSSFSSWR